ncbi:hypothetical protein PMAYCL1PPCAC_04407, partial [Pristionchus mayeri]
IFPPSSPRNWEIALTTIFSAPKSPTSLVTIAHSDCVLAVSYGGSSWCEITSQLLILSEVLPRPEERGGDRLGGERGVEMNG